MNAREILDSSSTDEEEWNSLHTYSATADDIKHVNAARKSRRHRRGCARRKPYRQRNPNNAVTFERSAISVPGPSVSKMYPIKSVFTLYCSNYGLEELCRIVFSSIKARTSAIADRGVTVDHLRYVTALAYFSRCLQVAPHYCRIWNEDNDSLIDATHGIFLPEVLCNYIEYLGTYKTPTGAVVGPWAGSPSDWYSQVGMWSPEVFLSRLGLEGQGPWFLNHKAVVLWNNITPILKSHSMRVRPVDYKKVEGNVSIMASCRGIPPQCEASSSIAMTDIEGSLGAAYQWRNLYDIAKLPGDTSLFCSPMCRGRNFNLTLFLNEIVLRSYDYP